MIQSAFRWWSVLCLSLAVCSQVSGDVPCVVPQYLAGFVSAPHSPGNVGLTEVNPVQAPDGTLYFTLQLGGAHYNGAIVKVVSGVMSTVYDFEGTQNPAIGSNPAGGLTLGTDGNLYGHTAGGGASNRGTLFRCTPGGVLTTLHSFSGTSSSPVPLGALLEASDGNFYGMTQVGGVVNTAGTVFRITPAGGFTELVAFTGSSAVDSPAEGSRPRGSLVERNEGGTKFLYGVLEQSGGASNGRIFRFVLPAAAASTATPQTVVRFTGTTGSFKGAAPRSGLRLASDGALYGTTSQGGVTGYGTLYRISAAGEFSTVFDFGTNLALAGGEPFTAPMLGADGFLYGTTSRNGGGVYRISMTGANPSVLVSYTSGGPMGQAPTGLVQAAGGQLYGLSEQGGPRSRGVLFRISGTGAARTTGMVLHFGLRGSTLEGAFPTGAIIESNGLYYGTTEEGGSELNNGRGYGTLYSMTPEGRLTTLISFTNVGTNGGIPGTRPKGALLRVGLNGSLYGTTSSGGVMGKGTIFRYHPDTGIFASIAYFSGTTANGGGAAGEEPTGALVNGNDGYLYGTTRYGGAGNFGTVFRIATLDSSMQTLAEFTGSSGARPGREPLCGLAAEFPFAGQPATAFYGVTTYGGTPNLGTLFKVTPAGVLTTRVQFTGATGANPGSQPNGHLVWNDGVIYGTTKSDGALGYGTVFIFNPVSGAHTVTVTFGHTSGTLQGRNPLSGLTPGPDGIFYGTNSSGVGGWGHGDVFRWNAGTGVVESVGAFRGLDMAASLPGKTPPLGGLSGSADGNLYGITYEGGPGNGTVYRLNFGTGIGALPPLKLASNRVLMRGVVAPNGTTVQIGFETVPEEEVSFPPYDYYSAGTANTPIEFTHEVTGFLPGATYLIRAVASGPCGIYYSSWVRYTLGTVYDSWKTIYFGDSAGIPSIAGDAVDSERDGIPNLVEFMTGTSALATNAPPLTASIVNAGGQRKLRFTYFRRTNADGGEALAVQVSTNLQTWQSLAAAGGSEAQTPGPIGNGESSVYQWEGTVPATGVRTWVRLRATRP